MIVSKFYIYCHPIQNNTSPLGFMRVTGMMYILTHILKMPLNHTVAMALQQESMFDYSGFVTMGMHDINWVYKLKFTTKQDTVVLRAANAYNLYLIDNGNSNKAMDPVPTQWHFNTFDKWKRNGYSIFLANEISIHTTLQLKNFNNEDRTKVTKKATTKVHRVRKRIITTTKPYPFDAGVTYTVTNIILGLSLTHPVA